MPCNQPQSDFEAMKFETLGDVAEAVQNYITENNIDLSAKGIA